MSSQSIRTMTKSSDDDKMFSQSNNQSNNQPFHMSQLHLGFSPDLLEGNDWSAHSFIEQALSPSITLDGLHQSLETLDKALQSSLVSLINEEYANFIGLSSSLTGVDDHLVRIDEWVTQMKSKLQAVYVLIHSARNEREKKRAEQLDAQHRMAFLKLLQTVIEHSKIIAQQIKLIQEWHKVIEHDQNNNNNDTNGLLDLTGLSMQAKYIIHHSIKKHQSINQSINQFGSRRSAQTRRGSIDAYDSDEDDEDDTELPHNHHTLTHSHSAHDAHSHSINPSFDLFNQLLASPITSLTPLHAERAHEQRIISHFNYACHLMQTLRSAQSLTRDFTIIEDLRPAIDNMNRDLDSLIQAALLRAIESNDKHSTLTTLMRMCILTDRLIMLHNFIRTSFISPRITNILTSMPLVIDTNNDDQPSNLEQIYNSVLTFLSTSINKLSLSASFASSLCNWHQLCFDELVSIMNNPSIVPELASQLSAPGVPHLFHYHYITTQKFLISYEVAMRQVMTNSNQVSDIVTFRQQPSYIALQKKFNVVIYYRLRQQQIATEIENKLIKPLHDTSCEDVIKLVESCLLRCWRSDVWLNELTNSFIKLTMQLIQRYVTWCTHHLVSVVKSQTNSETVDVINRSASPMPIEGSSNSSFLLSLYVASTRLSSWLNTTLCSVIVERLDDVDIAKGVIKACQSSLKQLQNNLLREVTTSFVTPLVAALAPMQRLKTTFRMTQTLQPSPYILNIIKLLNTSHDTIKQAELNASDVSTLVDSLLTSLYNAYEREIKQVISMVIKTEMSLNMMRNRSGTTATGNEKQDSDRIRAQLELDVTELTKTVHEMTTIGQKSRDDVKALHSVVQNAGAQ